MAGGLWSSLLLDKHGNVYGTTIAGGQKGKGGTAFKLSRRVERKMDADSALQLLQPVQLHRRRRRFCGLDFRRSRLTCTVRRSRWWNP